MLASSLRAMPSGVGVMTVTRSSSGLRERTIRCFCSSFFRRGVRVPESRRSISPILPTEIPSCSSQMTIMVMYWVYVSPILSR